jgi:NAD(P)-dependent dehydrogenase (short-subunit alcohol dehydrogenase family)
MQHADLPLKDKTALITGAARGIGAATARELAEQGAKVFLTDIDPSVSVVAEKLRAEGFVADSGVMDVSDAGDWQAIQKQCSQSLGAVDILVSNAYTVDHQPLGLMSRESWDRQIGVNLTGTYLAIQCCLDDLVRDSDGAVVLVSSVHAHFGLPGNPAYAASKAALAGLGRQLAAEYGQHMRVNTVLPGPVMTDAWAGISEANRVKSERATALGRLGKPEEIARVIAFLSSSQASFITGAEVAVDGGWSITKNSS